MFSENNSGKNIYSSIAGNNQVISLLMDLEDDRLVKKNGDQYPELTFLGRRIRDHFKKYELGAFN